MDDYVNEDHDEEADNSAVSRAVLISEPVCSSDEEYDNVRQNCTKDNKEKHYPMYVLDEVMENINMWVKQLPVSHDPETWTTHSPNVTLARRCILFEANEYRRNLINFEHLLEHGIVRNRTNRVKLRLLIRKEAL